MTFYRQMNGQKFPGKPCQAASKSKLSFTKFGEWNSDVNCHLNIFLLELKFNPAVKDYVNFGHLQDLISKQRKLCIEFSLIEIFSGNVRI